MPDGDAAARRGPGRPPRPEVVGVPGGVLAYGGGGVHCITQQVPTLMTDRAAHPQSTEPCSPSPARGSTPRPRPPFRIGAVQHRWHPDPAEHRAALAEGVRLAAGDGRAARVPAGADAVARTSRSPPTGPAAVGAAPEALPGGPTHAFAAELAAETGVVVHASLYEDAGDGGPRASTPRSCVAPDGALVARTRKLHIPVTAGYYEDRYFRPGDSGYPGGRPSATPRSASRRAGTSGSPSWPGPTRCAGAEVIVYPTAIGSEPDHPDFDTQPLWEQVIVGNGIANGTFMVAVNRIGTEAAADASTARRSSATRTAACWCRRRATSPRCWSPTSTSTSARDWLDAVPVPHHPPPRHLRPPDRAAHDLIALARPCARLRTGV